MIKLDDLLDSGRGENLDDLVAGARRKDPGVIGQGGAHQLGNHRADRSPDSRACTRFEQHA